MTVVEAYSPPENFSVRIDDEEVSVVDFAAHTTLPTRETETSLEGIDLLLTRNQIRNLGNIKGSVLKATKDNTRYGGMVISTEVFDPPERTEMYADSKLECRMYDGPGWNE